MLMAPMTKCAGCGQDFPSGKNNRGKEKRFCSIGCYRYRTLKPSPKKLIPKIKEKFQIEKIPTCDDEEFKAVIGFEEDYAVSNFGRVYSLKRLRFLSSFVTSGYMVVDLWRGSKRSHKRVHVLVAEAFLGPKPIGLEVNHKDLNRTNNAPSNLEYLTRSENVLHSVRNRKLAG